MTLISPFFLVLSVRNLHDRWSKDCTMYRDLYEAVQEVELTPRIDWSQVLEEKQVSLPYPW